MYSCPEDGLRYAHKNSQQNHNSLINSSRSIALPPIFPPKKKRRITNGNMHKNTAIDGRNNSKIKVNRIINYPAKSIAVQTVLQKIGNIVFQILEHCISFPLNNLNSRLRLLNRRFAAPTKTKQTNMKLLNYYAEKLERKKEFCRTISHRTCSSTMCRTLLFRSSALSVYR